jgi:formylglycine-generating enzyme required for sulfatase activity
MNTIGQHGSHMMQSKTPSQTLFSLMVDLFDEDELRTLAFELGFNYEELPTIFGISGKIRELIIIFEKEGRIPDLLAAVKAERPHAAWPDLDEVISLNSLLGEPEAPLLPFEPITVYVPAGPFLMGINLAENVYPAETPQHSVTLPSYRMGKYPITNQQYGEFVKQTGHDSPPASAGWMLNRPPAGKLDHPVVSVTWHDAVAYCQWLSGVTSKAYRLPSEAEWEKAARGADGRLYPWGNSWQEDACNHNQTGTTAVTHYEAFASPYGCVDMIGNVAEWVGTRWGENRQTPDYAYPYQLHDGRDNFADDPQKTRMRRLFRGGSYKDEVTMCRCTARAHIRPESASNFRGFRVALQER